MAGVSPGTIFTVPELVSMKPTDILEDTHPIASVCTLGMYVSLQTCGVKPDGTAARPPTRCSCVFQVGKRQTRRKSCSFGV
jgi:hypothetical protein